MAEISMIDIHDEHEAIKWLVQVEMSIRACRILWKQNNDTTLTQDMNTRYLIAAELEDAGTDLNRLKGQIVERIERQSYPFSLKMV
jgi:hypothetical protein